MSDFRGTLACEIGAVKQVCQYMASDFQRVANGFKGSLAVATNPQWEIATPFLASIRMTPSLGSRMAYLRSFFSNVVTTWLMNRILYPREDRDRSIPYINFQGLIDKEAHLGSHHLTCLQF